MLSSEMFETLTLIKKLYNSTWYSLVVVIDSNCKCQ